MKVYFSFTLQSNIVGVEDSIYKRVSELHTTVEGLRLLLRMLPYLHRACKVIWEKREIMKDCAEDFMSRPRCGVHHSCPLLSHRAPNLLQKKLGNVAPRGKCSRAANSARSLSLDDCYSPGRSILTDVTRADIIKRTGIDYIIKG